MRGESTLLLTNVRERDSGERGPSSPSMWRKERGIRAFALTSQAAKSHESSRIAQTIKGIKEKKTIRNGSNSSQDAQREKMHGRSSPLRTGTIRDGTT